MKFIKNITLPMGLLFFSLSVAVFSDWVLANENVSVCPIGKPVASWDFESGDLPGNNNNVVEWNGDHGGIVNIPDTTKQGIMFKYRGKGPTGDSTSEWRYSIKQPLSRTWEYIRLYQPKNYFHRHYVRLDAPHTLDPQLWSIGDKIINSKNMTAKVGGVSGNYLYIYDFTQRFDYNWGKGKKITNLDTSAYFVSEDSRNLGTNNKFSAQWQGKYSNAGMVVETEAKPPANGGEPGVSYFRPALARSKAHGPSGTIKSSLPRESIAFSQQDNGKTVEFVIERVRSTDRDIRDARYKIWKRTNDTDWQIVFENNNIYAWNNENYFDNGYILGWSNSGYSEDTIFYLLGWALWAEKPSFLP